MNDDCVFISFVSKKIVGIDSDNCAIRQWSGKRLADLRTTLRQEAARDIRISLRRDVRRELNAKLRVVKVEQLNRLLAGYFDRGKQTLEMQLPDGPSSDRHAWAVAAGKHGREIYRDDNNMWMYKCNVWFVFSIWHTFLKMTCGRC